MPPTFLISLDFELFWGIRDKSSLERYGANILGVRSAIPEMLRIFRKYQVHVTWATVGFLLFDSKKELLDFLPSIKPDYVRPELNPHLVIDSIGDSERADPYHFGLSLVRQILDCESMELGSHTFSHYYCREEGPSLESFRADLVASVAATKRLTDAPVSLVFPRNQYTDSHLQIAANVGFEAVRTNEKSWFYQSAAREGAVKRGLRLADSYLDISGNNAFEAESALSVVKLPSSRFLRPYNLRLKNLEFLRLHRIASAMTYAARNNMLFHLWWHPHNFGMNIERNISMLETILRHYADLREEYAFHSLTMGEAARRYRMAA